MRGAPESGSVSVRRHAQAEVRWLYGEVNAASDSFASARAADASLEPTVSEIEAHAYAGKLALAASLTELLRERAQGRSAREQQRLSCVADALRARAGDRAAAARLDLAATDDPSCATLASEARHHRILRYEVDPETHGFEAFDPWRRFADRRLAADYVDWLLDHPDDTTWIRDVPLAHEAAALATRPRGAEPGLDEARTYALYAARLATFHAHMGEPSEALAVLAEPLAAFEAAIARTSTARESDVLDGMVLLASARAARAAGDAAGAEALLRFLDEHVARREYLRAAIDTTHHAAARPLEPRFVDPCRTCGLPALAEAIGRQREAARDRGDARSDARLRPIARRVSALLLDPDLRTILHALETFENAA